VIAWVLVVHARFAAAGGRRCERRPTEDCRESPSLSLAALAWCLGTSTVRCTSLKAVVEPRGTDPMHHRARVLSLVIWTLIIITSVK